MIREFVPFNVAVAEMVAKNGLVNVAGHTAASVAELRMIYSKLGWKINVPEGVSVDVPIKPTTAAPKQAKPAPVKPKAAPAKGNGAKPGKTTQEVPPAPEGDVEPH